METTLIGIASILAAIGLGFLFGAKRERSKAAKAKVTEDLQKVDDKHDDDVKDAEEDVKEDLEKIEETKVAADKEIDKEAEVLVADGPKLRDALAEEET